MKNLFIIVITLMLAISSISSNATTLEEARQQALDFGATYKNSALNTITDINKQATPGYTTDNPEQTKYYQDGDMSADAIEKTRNSQEGDFMTKTLMSVKRYNLNENDDFLNNSKAIEGNPDEVIAMLTGTYGECKPIENKKTETEVRTCDEYEEPNCIDGKDLVSVSGDNTDWNYPTLSQNISPRSGGSCGKFYVYSTINIKDVTKIDVFALNYITWDDVISVKINNIVVFNNGDTNASSCERETVFRSYPNINIKSYLQNGNNLIELKVGIAGKGHANASYTLSYEKDKKCQTVSTCRNIPSNCSLQTSQCININNQNICNYRQYTYICSTITTTSSASVQCGSNIYCTNNQCTKIEEDSNQDFATSIAYLSSINEAAKDNDISNLKIFTGSSKRCGKDTVSYNNCCKDDGWGQDYVGATCNEEEKTLVELQSKKLCHYVGSYCSEKIPLTGKCLKTKRTYCCFNSKISRIITEQGRMQLSKDWGSAEAPNCIGFTADELSRLRFDQMDLSEISSDIANSVIIPNQSYIEDKVKQTMERYEKNSN